MQETKVKVVVADPSAIGLFGLAMVTLVASSQKLGLTEGVSLVLPWAIFLGATAQLLACLSITTLLEQLLLVLMHSFGMVLVLLG